MGLLVIGVDLAGSILRPTGLAIVHERSVTCMTLYSSEDIVKVIAKTRPRLIAIDAPLSLPLNGRMRCVDRMMHKLGFPVLPPLFPGMKALTIRGLILKALLEESGMNVIEVHPRSSLKALKRIWGRSLSLSDIASKLGLCFSHNPKNKHEEDAFLAAITALLHLRGRTRVISCVDGEIVLPRW